MESDGYLYLPGLFEREKIKEVRLSILEELAEQNDIFDPNYPLIEGRVKEGSKLGWQKGDFLKKNPLAQKLLYSGRIIDFFENFFEEKVSHFTYTWFRNMLKGRGAPPHCDIVYMGRGTPNLYTVWTPFGDVSMETGGLMVLENSQQHTETIKNYLERDVDSYCVNRPEHVEKTKRNERVYTGALTSNAFSLREKLGGRWLSNDYKMGDAIIFPMTTIHGSLDNQSELIRLSTDTRYQRASEPMDERWIGEKPTGHGDESKRGLIC